MIVLGMYDVVVQKMNWLFNYWVSMDCFTKKILFEKLVYPELKFEGDRMILPTCVISALEVNRLLHKG